MHIEPTQPVGGGTPREDCSTTPLARAGFCMGVGMGLFDNEEWRKIDGWPYEVSDFGRVRNLRNGYILNPSLDGQVCPMGTEYLRVTLHDKDRSLGQSVHSLVALAFLGPRPPDHHVDHINSVRSDNRLGNLRYLHATENSRQGKHWIRGERGSSAKVTERIAEEIRVRYATEDVTMKGLGSEYGIAKGTVVHILKGRTWAHVGGPTNVRKKRGKLSRTDVVQIKVLLRQGENQGVIAKMFRINSRTVSKINTGCRHKEIEI